MWYGVRCAASGVIGTSLESTQETFQNITRIDIQIGRESDSGKISRGTENQTKRLF